MDLKDQLHKLGPTGIIRPLFIESLTSNNTSQNININPEFEEYYNFVNLLENPNLLSSTRSKRSMSPYVPKSSYERFDLSTDFSLSEIEWSLKLLKSKTSLDLQFIDI